MKDSNCSLIKRFGLGILKVSLTTLVLDSVYLATKLPIHQFGLIFTFLLVSLIVAILGAIFIGLPVGLILIKRQHQNNLTSALICGVIVFLIMFFYLNDGKLNSHNFQGSFIFSVYGACCGYAFMYGFKKENINESI